jgi:Ca2+-binding EF-hand superfamily protein
MFIGQQIQGLNYKQVNDIFLAKDPEQKGKMKIEHFAKCMKEIKLKLSQQEMSDL